MLREILPGTPPAAFLAKPPQKALEELEKSAQTCRRCPLYKNATQAVCGRGPHTAPLMIVGEQPGDQEDKKGEPFVGPAGRILDEALKEAGVARNETYVTNVVKHFKFELRGKRRLHKEPSASEIDACQWWLNLERAIVKPKLILAMGASAIRGVTGRSGSVRATRAKPIRLDDGARYMTTVHPSFLLRIREADSYAQERARFVADLAAAKRVLDQED